MPAETGLAGRELLVRYQPHLPPVIDGQSIDIPTGKITALIGPNGSGKSTLLKTLARQLVADQGRVVLNGQDLATLGNRDLARKIGIQFQENSAPADLVVEELVLHGRFPHRRLFDAVTAADEAAVEEALRLADLLALRRRPLQQLSAGQRQLAWIAMAVAQGPDYLFLDEPTTFLDLAHQFDVMDLVQRLNRAQSRTIILVLHDLNLAARYADHLVAMRQGRIAVSGTPAEVLTGQTLRAVFEVEAEVIRDDAKGTIFCVPHGKTTHAAPGGSP